MKTGKIFFIVLMIFLAGCAHYSVTAERTEEDNTIVAPIDVVWQKTLNLLPNEGISVERKAGQACVIVLLSASFSGVA